MTRCLFPMLVVVALLSQSLVLRAQVFNAPTPQPNAQVQQTSAVTVGESESEARQTGWGGIPLPKITMPKLTLPKVTMPDMSSVTGPVKSGFGKVSSGTKKAWEGTKEMFSVAKSKPAPAPYSRTTQEKKPSFWSRLVTREPEPRVPQTVGEFMSQPRLDP